MKITSVNVHKKEDDSRMKGIASVLIDDCFVIRDIRIIEGKDGLFIAMPSRKIQNGEFKDIAHPINSDTRDKIQQAVLDEYAKADAE